MQTRFSAEQLGEPAMAASEAVIRKCVHCGFCTATCPTYVLLGDELDSPRGRIYLIKDMLEQQREPTAAVVKHIDRCLSCLACMTTCPSDVNYMRLVDHARAYIEQRYRRPFTERFFRALLAAVLPHPRRFRAALFLARLVRPAAVLMGRVAALQPLVAMLSLAPRRAAARPAAPLSTPYPVQAPAQAPAPTALAPRGRVVLMQGCAEPVLKPQIRAATLRLLNRAGYDVEFAKGEGCCGALVHHLGREHDSLAAARRNVDIWASHIERGLDAIVITTSGCGPTIKDYGFLLRNEPAYAARALRVSALAKDISELLDEVGLPPISLRGGLTVAYHSPCSMQHGQKILAAPQRLLKAAGFVLKIPAEAHLCCGSAGTYNLLQPTIAGQLGRRKVANIAILGADVIATGNVGCAMQIGKSAALPVVHTVELLDWATGGPMPEALRR